MKQNNYEFEIVLELLSGKKHIRAISKKLKTNPMNISRKINILSKENVVDYDLEGKNKSYFLKETLEAKTFIIMAEEYKLLKILKKYPDLKKIFEKIKEDSRIEISILFGSFAKEIAKEDSDIDIYIESKDKKIKSDLELIDSRLSIKLGNYDAKNLLIKEIVKNHALIKGVEKYYEKNELFT